MRIVDIILEELKKNNIEFYSNKKLLEQLNNFIQNYNYEIILKKMYPRIDDGFLSLIDKLSLEQLIILKLELSYKKTKNEVLPKWFFQSLDDIIRFIIVKYSLSVFNNIFDVCKYLDISIEDLEKFIRENLKDYFVEV